MMTVNPVGYSQMGWLLSEWITLHSHNSPLSGHTQKDQARREGHKSGMSEGAGIGIAAYVNLCRVQYFDKWQYVPVVTGLDVVQDVLRPALKRWNEMKEELAATSYATAKEDRAAMSQAQQDWERYAVDLINQLAIPDALEEQEKNRHRSAVLQGTEDATEEDRSWIEEHAAKAKATADRITALLQ